MSVRRHRADRHNSKGERLPTVANFKLTASAQYTPCGNSSQTAEGVIRFDYTYNGDSTNGIPGSIFLFGDTSQVPQIQDAYSIGNASLALNFEKFDVTFSVRNIWDERADLFIHPRFNDGRIVTNTPRNFNLGVRMRF
ncbi:MAG: TonB-dependent receptor [Parvularculaceae bacterium]